MNALPLLPAHEAGARVAWWRGGAISREEFLNHVARVAARLPDRAQAINLCEDRYLFLVAFAAVLARAQTNLLPPSRISLEIQTLATAYPDHHVLTDHVVAAALTSGEGAPDPAMPRIAERHVAAIAFTSGSTGRSRPHLKYWGDLVHGARLAQQCFGVGQDPTATLVATVPPQHMYGLETSILLPLVSGVAVHGSRPFFPADVHAVLTAIPAPRMLITTPAHLRVCAESGLAWPSLAFIISATAPLGAGLAAHAETVFGAPVLEIYGCTEAGSLASRRTVAGDPWQLFDGLRIEGEYAQGPHLPEPVRLNDVVEPLGDNRFKLLGRQEDMVNIAGKRASLIDLTRRLNEIASVIDGVFLMEDVEGEKTQRLTALVVAPALDERRLLAALAERVDPAFLPRPLYKVESLPRNETGKLPRGALLDLLAELRRRRGASS